MDNIQALIDKVKDESFFNAVVGIYSPLPEADTIPLEVYRRIESDIARKALTTRLVNNINNKNKPVTLGTHTRCICAETGIPFAVSLPSPLETSMTLLHPFAFHNNVVTFIKGYQKNGIPIAGLQPTVLAGMLITILKHKGFASCRDYVKANVRLSQVNKRSLTWALTYFYRAQPRFNLPQINLLAEGNPTTQLIGFVQICRGEDDSIQAHHMLETKQKTIKAKVYQTEHDRESAELKNDIKTCYEMLERIQKENPLVFTDTLINTFEQRISKLAVLNDAAKAILIADIIGCFGENPNTKAMEVIIRSNDMSATQKELLTFSMEIEKEIKEFQGKQMPKLDFNALMGRKKDGE